MNDSAALPSPRTATMANVANPSTGTVYATVTTANPITTERIACSRLSPESSPTTLIPIQRITPTLPRMSATKTAHETSGTTAIPTTDNVSSRITGPVSSSTSRPARKVVSGFSHSVRAQTRTGS